MKNLNREQTKQALKACIDRNCKECPMTEGRGCAIRLYTQALNTIVHQETEYNELYELYESLRAENERLKAIQTPKKPMFVDVRFRNHGRHVGDGCSLDKCYKCPNCQSHVFHVFDIEHNCIHCGQLLDWDNVEGE